MTDATLASDIGLLEEVERAAAAAQRGVALPPGLADAVAKASKGGGGGGGGKSSHQQQQHHHHPSPSSPSPSLPPHLQQLVAEASRRGVRLRLAPPGFEARRRSGTRYDGKQKKMHWHLEWRFYDGCSSKEKESSFVRREDRRIREDAPLGPFLRRHLASIGSAEKEEDEEKAALPIPFLAAAAAAPSSPPAPSTKQPPLPFRALLRLDGRPANNPGWLEFTLNGKAFDEEVTLAELLRGRTVAEFPVVALFAAAEESSLPPGEVVAFARASPAIVPVLPAAAAAGETEQASL